MPVIALRYSSVVQTLKQQVAAAVVVVVVVAVAAATGAPGVLPPLPPSVQLSGVGFWLWGRGLGSVSFPSGWGSSRVLESCGKRCIITSQIKQVRLGHQVRGTSPLAYTIERLR